MEGDGAVVGSRVAAGGVADPPLARRAVRRTLSPIRVPGAGLAGWSWVAETLTTGAMMRGAFGGAVWAGGRTAGVMAAAVVAVVVAVVGVDGVAGVGVGWAGVDAGTAAGVGVGRGAGRGAGAACRAAT